MLLPLLLAMLAASQSTSRDLVGELADPLSGEKNAMVVQRATRLDPPKLSPKEFDGKHWEFDWITSGYGLATTDGQMDLRFRVYSQERKPDSDLALSVAMQDMRMWQLLHDKYKIDHKEMGDGLKLVDEYLCWGGTAGGEQTLGEESENGHVRRVNTIYIYDLASFDNPLEMAREVAHEYGHAVLPAIGGFKTPEDWANGYLGERLFLRWLRDGMEAGHVDSRTVMGVSCQALDGWVRKNVDPLVLDAASHAPNVTLLGGQGQKAMDAYMGLVLYADSVLPAHVVSRSFLLTGSTSARDYPDALALASSEGSYTLSIPNMLYGKKIWIPLGKSKVQGAKVLSRSASWAEIQPTAPSVVVLAPGS